MGLAKINLYNKTQSVRGKKGEKTLFFSGVVTYTTRQPHVLLRNDRQQPILIFFFFGGVVVWVFRPYLYNTLVVVVVLSPCRRHALLFFFVSVFHSSPPCTYGDFGGGCKPLPCRSTLLDRMRINLLS